jgi:hypothetical protein
LIKCSLRRTGCIFENFVLEITTITEIKKVYPDEHPYSPPWQQKIKKFAETISKNQPLRTLVLAGVLGKGFAGFEKDQCHSYCRASISHTLFKPGKN